MQSCTVALGHHLANRPRVHSCRAKEALSVKAEGFGPSASGPAHKAANPSRSDEMTACHATNPDINGSSGPAAAAHKPLGGVE